MTLANSRWAAPQPEKATQQSSPVGDIAPLDGQRTLANSRWATPTSAVPSGLSPYVDKSAVSESNSRDTLDARPQSSTGFAQPRLNLKLGWFPSDKIQPRQAMQEVLSLPPQPFTDNPYMWSIYPLMHDKVSEVLQKSNLNFDFHPVDDPGTWVLDLCQTNIQAKFCCRNRACKRWWKSQAVKIEIRIYLGQKYNARVYFQHCALCMRICQAFFLEEEFAAIYVEHVTYWIKKWCGLDPATPMPPQRRKGEQKRPNGEHRSDLCEGCMAGICTRGQSSLTNQGWLD